MKTFFVFAATAALMFTGVAVKAQAPDVADSHTIIRSDSRLVLVDSIVTDKKGGYVHGLAQKDFKVWEDGKEQPISSFSFQADSPDADQKHYLVLFFDNSTLTAENQSFARDAAMKFIDTNAGPNRLISIVEFTNSLRVAQNFTDDVDRLKKVAGAVKLTAAAVQAPQVSATGRNAVRDPLAGVFTNYSTRTLLGALRDMAKGLAKVPGRKTVVFISGGFPLTQDQLPEMTAVINECNHANVAIYPIDARGMAPLRIGTIGMLRSPATLPQLALLNAATLLSPLAFQAKGGGGVANGGGGAAPGGAAGSGSTGSAGAGSSAGGGLRGSTPGGATTGNSNIGSTTGSGARTGNTSGGNNNNGNGLNSGFDASGRGMPNDLNGRQRMSNEDRFRQLGGLGEGLSGMNAGLMALANGTGGFMISNTNDLLSGLQKIGKEQSEYYVVGYVPTKELEPGACHTIKLKVEHSANIRYRTGYCDAKGVDILSGTPTQRELEARLTANATPTITATLQAPFFYISPNTARVDVALDIPGDGLKFVKDKGKFQLKLNVIGIAYLPDGGVGARFSDSVRMAFDEKKQVEEFTSKPFHYEKQFEVASGQFNLKVIFSSSADSFGRIDTPLTIDPWDSGKFILSGLALSKSARPAAGVGLSFDALLDEKVPLVVNGVQITPAGTNHFHKSEKAYIYAEMYEPALTVTDSKEYPALGVQMVLMDAKTDKVSKDMGVIRIESKAPPGNPAVPMGLIIPVADLTAGSYIAQITALDATGSQSMRRVGFEVEP